MATVRLNKRTIEALEPRTNTLIVYDDTLKGFGVRVTPAGARSYIVDVRSGSAGGSRRRITLGKVGVLTPDQAREEARKKLAAASLGHDPAQEREERRRALALCDLALRWRSEEIALTRKPGTAALYGIYMNKHILPRLGTLPARDITYSHIARLHREIGVEAKVTANRVVAALSGLFSWAAKVGEIPRDHNPTRDITLFKEKGRERYLNEAELERLGRAIEEAETVGVAWEPNPTKKAKHAPKDRRVRISVHAAAAIRLLALTGARLREVLHLRWDQVDFARALASLPDSKTGAKVIPLSTAALEIISSLPRVSDYVIAGDRPNRPRADLQRPWDAVRRLAGLEGVRIHDLRHSHASMAAASGLSLTIIGELLGHRQASTTKRYVHLTGTPVQVAAERVSSSIEAAMRGRPDAEVVPLRARLTSGSTTF
jgi:integrase